MAGRDDDEDYFTIEEAVAIVAKQRGISYAEAEVQVLEALATGNMAFKEVGDDGTLTEGDPSAIAAEIKMAAN